MPIELLPDELLGGVLCCVVLPCCVPEFVLEPVSLDWAIANPVATSSTAKISTRRFIMCNSPFYSFILLSKACYRISQSRFLVALNPND